MGTFLLLRELWRLVRGERQRTRKLRWLFGLLRPYRGRVVVTLVALVAATAAGLAPPYLAGRAIDNGIATHDLSALDLIVVAFVLSALVYWAATYTQTYLVGWVGQRALQDLRERIYTHLQGMSIGFFTRNRPGVLISRLTNDVEALDTLVTDGVVTLISSTLTLLGVVVILLLLDLPLALVTFVTFPLLAVGSVVFRIASSGAYRLTREKIANITAYLQETLSGRAGGAELRAGAAPPGADGGAQRGEPGRQHDARSTSTPPTSRRSSCCRRSAPRVILLYGGYQAIDGNIQIGVLVAFVGYLNAFFDPIQQISQLYTTYQQGMAALDKIFDLLETQPDMVDQPDALDPGRLRGEIELDDVSFSYGEEDWALDGIDLHIPAGQTVALVGETGAGKSTLAKLVARFYDPQRGRLLVDGHDLRELSSRALRSQLGIVPQEGFLFSGTVRENIAFGRPDASEEEIRAAADAVGADTFIERLRDGYETEIGERGVQPVGRAAAAGRVRAGAACRAAHPDPRRGDVERGRADGADHRAGAGAAAAGTHRDRDRAPAVDDQAGGADRGAGARPDRRGGHARRADRGGRSVRAPVRRLGRAGGVGAGRQRPVSRVARGRGRRQAAAADALAPGAPSAAARAAGPSPGAAARGPAGSSPGGGSPAPGSAAGRGYGSGRGGGGGGWSPWSSRRARWWSVRGAVGAAWLAFAQSLKP